MSSPPIVIAGAGLAGLTLGRCLLSKGIPTLVIEKASSSLRRHDYSIDLYSWAYRPLLSVLNVEEAAFREKLSVNSRISNTDSSTVQSLLSGENKPLDRFRCHRGRLEALLGGGLDIRWDHGVVGVSLGPRRITVNIDDRPPIETAALVAADGVHSAVRKSQGLEIEPEIHHYVVFYGTRSISKEQYATKVAPQMQYGVEIASRHDDVLLRIFINNTSSTHIDLGYTYSRLARPGPLSDPLYRPNRPVAGAKDIPEAFYTELGSLTDLTPASAEIFDPAKVRQDRVLHWLMRSLLSSRVHAQSLADVGVVMIGDAVHAMPVLGSEGGNMAIRDGVELAEWIAKYGTRDLGMFVKGRYQEWRGNVERGVKRLENMHDEERASL